MNSTGGGCVFDWRLLVQCAAGAACLLALAGAGASASGPTISGVTVEPQRAARFGKLEVTFSLSRVYDNPFDPGQIDAIAVIESPSARRIELPAFPYQDYRSVREGDRENLEPVGDLVWKVRFAPDEAGRYRLRLRARDAQGQGESDQLTFEAAASDSDGFIRRSARAPRRFEFDSGKPYFALGENVCWSSHASPLQQYETWFDHLGQSGCSFARLWLAGPWIATAPIHSPDHPEEVGPGRYSQRNSWRLDRVLQMAEERGLYLMLCLDSFNSLRASEPYPAFDQYPLNAKLGGPLGSPVEFFTNPEARKLIQQRLRYYVARWGYSSHVFAWEFWNEVDLVEGYDSRQVSEWHREMARYLRALDPWRHLITTSFARSDGDPAIDGLPEMDFVQTHSYGGADIAGSLLWWSKQKAQEYDKPHFVGEFGLGGSGQEDAADKEGVHLHNGLWATALSGDAGSAMTWWWDSYVEPANLYYHFAALKRFLQGVDWTRAYSPAALRQAQNRPGGRVGRPEASRGAAIEQVSFPAGAPPHTSDLSVNPAVASWDKHPANEPREYAIGREGSISDADKLSRVLHGVVNHPNEHNPPTFVVDYPAEGGFEVIIGGVSGYGGANLRIRLDGETKLAAEFPDEAPDDTETMRQYDGAYRIAVPAGRHRITVENEGRDWAFASYRFVGCVTSPDIRVVGLATSNAALLWIQHKASTWWNAVHGVETQPVPPVSVTLVGLADGDYGIEWWDTYTGAPVGAAAATARDGRITFLTPAIARDIAGKIRRAR